MGGKEIWEHVTDATRFGHMFPSLERRGRIYWDHISTNVSGPFFHEEFTLPDPTSLVYSSHEVKLPMLVMDRIVQY